MPAPCEIKRCVRCDAPFRAYTAENKHCVSCKVVIDRCRFPSVDPSDLGGHCGPLPVVILRAARAALGAPKLPIAPTREALIDWLTWNDPSGEYSDHASRREYGYPMDYDECLMHIALSLGASY